MKCEFEGYIFLYDRPNLLCRVYSAATVVTPLGQVSIPVLVTHGRTMHGRERIGTIHQIERRPDGVYCKGYVAGFSPHRLAIMRELRQGKLCLSAGTPGCLYRLDRTGLRRMITMPIAEISLTSRPANPWCKAIVTPRSVAIPVTKLEKTLRRIRNCKQTTEKRE